MRREFSYFIARGSKTVFRQFEHILSNDYESCQKLGQALSTHKTGLSPHLVILVCQDSASCSAGHEDPMHVTTQS